MGKIKSNTHEMFKNDEYIFHLIEWENAKKGKNKN